MFRRKLYVVAATGFIATVACGWLKMAEPTNSLKYVLKYDVRKATLIFRQTMLDITLVSSSAR